MVTYYAEFAFKSKKVVKIDADNEEEALNIARATMDSPDGPASGLTVESSWGHCEAPRLVDDFSTRVRKQSEGLRSLDDFWSRAQERCDSLKKAEMPLIHQEEPVGNQQTYYFSVPFSGQVVAQIKAFDEERARISLQSEMRNFGLKKLEAPFINWSLERGEPKMVKSDLT